MAEPKSIKEIIKEHYPELAKAIEDGVNETKNNLMKAQSDLVRAKYEHMYQNALLNFYRGKGIAF